MGKPLKALQTYQFRPLVHRQSRPRCKSSAISCFSAETRIFYSREVLICVSAFTVVFVACGLNFAYGVYQDLYEQMALEADTAFTGASQASISLIGTLSCAFMQIAAPVASAWLKRFSPRLVLIVSGALYLAACLMASYSVSLWQFTLTQGFLMGLGTCFAFTTAVTVTPCHYTARRGLAMGIILSGTGVGGLAIAPAVQAMNAKLGFRMTLRILGGVAAAVIWASSFLLDWDEVSKERLRVEAVTRPKSLAGRVLRIPLVDWKVAKSKAFVAQACGTTFHGAAYYVPLFYFSSFARTLGYSPAAGANFIAVNNACNALGKIVLGYIADRWVGRINMLVITICIATLGTASCWIPSALLNGGANSQGLFIAFSILFGTFASAYVSLFPAALVEIFGPAQYSSVNGLLYLLRGLGGLIGTPIGGELIRGSGMSMMPKGYWSSAVLVSAFLFACTVSVAWSWLEVRKTNKGLRRLDSSAP